MSTTITNRRGDIRNRDYAYKAKTYSWGKMSRLFGGGVSPTDIDGVVEINGYFLAVEFKTETTKMERGQSLFFERWLHRLRRHGLLFVCEHPRLDPVEVDEHDIKQMSVWWWEPECGGVAKLEFFNANDATLAWFFENWTSHARQQSNSLVRCVREKLGLYPSSVVHPFKRVGGLVIQPPFVIRPSEEQIRYFSQ